MIDEKKLAQLWKEWSGDEPWDLANCVLLMDTVRSLWKVVRAAGPLAEAFIRMRNDHDEKLGKSYEEACKNWDSIRQEPLEFGPLLDALAALKEKA